MAFTVLCQRHREGITSGLITPMVGRTQKYEAKKKLPACSTGSLYV